MGDTPFGFGVTKWAVPQSVIFVAFPKVARILSFLAINAIRMTGDFVNGSRQGYGFPVAAFFCYPAFFLRFCHLATLLLKNVG
jgi:hypothetical protein